MTRPKSSGKFAAKGKTLDANQEMLALGLCNICGSFVRSMPITGSFTRTAVNNASGVKTPMGGAVTGGLVLLACGLLTSTFKFIPKATLAAVIIIAMFYMFETRIFVVLWRTKSKISIALINTFQISLNYTVRSMLRFFFIVCFTIQDTDRIKIWKESLL